MSNGEQLRTLRRELALSIGEAARALGVSTVAYNRLENDKEAQLGVMELAEVMMRRASASKHHPELARKTAELERALGAADAYLLRRDSAPPDKRYARGVADVLAWLVGCAAEKAFELESLR